MIYEVYSEFQRRLGSIGMPIIAGGAARDHLMGRTAKDYDLFILGNKFTNEARELVQKCIPDLEVVKQLEFHQSEPYLVVTVRWQGVDVQIMLNPAATVDELLSTFDWNVCLFAYDGSKFVERESIDNIGYGKTLYLNKVTFPLSTLRRGFRFSERFQMELPRPTAQMLCARVTEGFQGKPAMPDITPQTEV